MKKNNKRKNFTLALFMSFAIVISGFGAPGISLVSAADEGARQVAETPVLEETSAKAEAEKAVTAEAEEAVQAEEKATAVEEEKTDAAQEEKAAASEGGKAVKAEEEAVIAEKTKTAVTEEKEAAPRGDNPDHLTGPEKAKPNPVISDSKADPYLDKESPRSTNRPAAKIHRLTPGYGAIELTKKAEPVSGKLNTFKVTLRMEATDKEQKNDIVMVIDTSGSMHDNGRMSEAKKAAKQFVNKLLDENHPNTRIALVTFQTNVNVKKNFTNYANKQELLNAIDSLYANGGTFTQAGIKTASDLLNSSHADFKNIVLLSDGVPTFNYSLHNPDNYLEDGGPGSHTREKQTSTAMPRTAFDYSQTTGSGNSMWSYYKTAIVDNHYVYYHYNSGNCAIAEAGYAKLNAKVYTVAVNAGNTGNTVLEKMANSGCSYSTENPTALSGIFDSIAASIGSAMKDANVSDPMGTGFEVKGGTASNIQVTQGTVTLNNNTINWDVGTLNTSVTPGSMTRYAEMTYEVVINDSILDLVSPADGNYNTNAGAMVHYTDIDGNRQTKAFPEPKAKPLIIEMHKKLLDFKGREIPAAYTNGCEYNFNVKLKEDAGFNQDYLVPGNKSKVMVDLQIDKAYEIRENSISGYPASYLSDYDSSIQWETWDGTQGIESIDGTHLDQFVVPRGGSENDPLNTKITVTNQEKALGKLVIKKTFNPSDLRGSVANDVRSGLYGSTPKYKITVVGTNPYGGDDEVYREVHELSAGQEKTIENLPYGHYTVSEPGQEPAPNFVDSDGANDDGKVDLLINKKEATVEIINRPKDNDYKTEVTASKHWVNGPEADHTAPDLELYADGVLKTDAEPTVTPGDGTANEFTYVWTDLQKYNQSGNEIVYTVKERGVTADHNVVVHGHTYAVTQEGNKITNTYTQPQTDEDVKAYKTWADADGFNPKPEIKFELWRRNGTAGDGEAVAGTQENPNPQVVPESGEVNFGKQLKTDVNGVEYEYYVRETFTNEYERNNWIVTGEGTLEVTNTLLGEADRGGKLTIRKVLKNEATDEPGLRGASVRPGGDNALKFKFVVKGPNGYSKEVELKAGEEITLDKLLYGMYKVEEIENHGFATSYDPENGEGLVEANPVTVTVTNTNDGRDELNVKKTIKKVWVNGDKPAIKIQLWRKGTAADGTAIDEMVNEFTTTAGQDSEKEFTKTSQGVLLAKYDPQGNAYEYYAKEENVPENYKATYSDDKLTVTNTYVKSENQKPDVKPNPSSVKVHKVKTDDSSALNLYGGTGAAAILLIALMLAFRRRSGRKEQK